MSAGISQCDEKDRPCKSFKREPPVAHRSPYIGGKIETILKLIVKPNRLRDDKLITDFSNKINEQIVVIARVD